MTPTAAQILQRCQDILKKKYPANGREVEIRTYGYNISYLGFGIAVHETSSVHSLEKASFLLGMDKSPAEIELKWETERTPICTISKAEFNNLVSCLVEDFGACVRANVLIYGAGRIYMEPQAVIIEDAQQWCLDTIKSIVTQNL